MSASWIDVTEGPRPTFSPTFRQLPTSLARFGLWCRLPESAITRLWERATEVRSPDTDSAGAPLDALALFNDERNCDSIPLSADAGAVSVNTNINDSNRRKNNFHSLAPPARIELVPPELGVPGPASTGGGIVRR